MFFNLLIIIAHIQAIIFPIYFGYKSTNKFKNIKYTNLPSLGFISIGLASLSEMIDHTFTNWIYVNHSSFFNWLFYSFLTIGLMLLSISIIKEKLFLVLNILACIFAISSYWTFGKSFTLFFQALISFSLIVNWQNFFKDWLFLLYPIFGIFLTTYFGSKLTLTNDQIWHVFIGPSGTLSVMTFYFVLCRSNKKHLKSI